VKAKSQKMMMKIKKRKKKKKKKRIIHLSQRNQKKQGIKLLKKPLYLSL
jgi:hypothetical protein